MGRIHLPRRLFRSMREGKHCQHQQQLSVTGRLTRITEEPTRKQSPILYDQRATVRPLPSPLRCPPRRPSPALCPLYSLPKAERRIARLRQEKRKVIARTSEFLSLRLSFTMEALSAMVHKEARRQLERRGCVVPAN